MASGVCVLQINVSLDLAGVARDRKRARDLERLGQGGGGGEFIDKEVSAQRTRATTRALYFHLYRSLFSLKHVVLAASHVALHSENAGPRFRPFHRWSGNHILRPIIYGKRRTEVPALPPLEWQSYTPANHKWLAGIPSQSSVAQEAAKREISKLE